MILKKKKNELLSKTESIFILDVAQIKNDFKIFFNKITNKNIKIIIYNQEIRSINYDYLIIPYIQKKKYKSSRVIEGNKAIIINYKLKNSFILKKKFFIFINMGATDNNNFTYQVLKKLTNFYNNKLFQINVVVGPFFKKIQIKKIKKITRAVNNINLLNDQENYIKNMQKSSLAIINSGNVKYEIAHLGIPFILMANDKLSLKYCKIFKKTNTELNYYEYINEEYTQLYGSFKKNLSVIDLIFNNGPRSKDILRKNFKII